MSCSVLFEDLQPQHLVVRNGELGQGEYGALALMPPHDFRVVAYAEYFERRPLLRRAFYELPVGDDETPVVHLEGDIRLVHDLRVDVDDVVMDVYTRTSTVMPYFPV